MGSTSILPGFSQDFQWDFPRIFNEINFFPPRLATHLALTAGSRFISSTWDQHPFSRLPLFVPVSTVNLARCCCLCCPLHSQELSKLSQFGKLKTGIFKPITIRSNTRFHHWHGRLYLVRLFHLVETGRDRHSRS